MGTPPPLPPRRLDYAARESRPWWVTMGLFGIPTRAMAIGWLVVSLLVAVGTGLFLHPLGWALLGATAWYWACIAWVDRHGTWN